LLGLFGSGEHLKTIINILAIAGGMILASSAFSKSKD